MLLPLPGWQNFIHLSQFQSSSQIVDETYFTKQFNTSRPSFEQNSLLKPENSFFNTVIFHDFKVTILAQFHIWSTTTLRLSATVYYIKSQPPSRDGNIVSSPKLGKNRAVPRDQISPVMYPKQPAQKTVHCRDTFHWIFLYIQEFSLHTPGSKLCTR